ncbi:DUF1534 domain-containing protein [Pseudomonas syringae]|nr:DUF1534 domain-containing protein [Pseudomonas syringae]MCF5739013.1 DUF1534 domain-containing protein [Pseudomonas syringae]MCF5748762.1 DUF1534 domain-containing protein [Pseudomonas syringae]MCF5757901.1 DUF1534 domain-containing protein [Pseudomonas syringae]
MFLILAEGQGANLFAKGAAARHLSFRTLQRGNACRDAPFSGALPASSRASSLPQPAARIKSRLVYDAERGAWTR